jgi:hypothetical protein
LSSSRPQNRLTTYHINIENNFLLQLSGTKDVNLFRREDGEATTKQENERFHSIDTNLATYKPHLQHHAEAAKMKPGVGVARLPQAASLGYNNHSGWRRSVFLNRSGFVKAEYGDAPFVCNNSWP